MMISTLDRDIFPWIGSRSVATLHAADVLDCLKRIQRRGALETAHRARANCRQVMRYAVATRRADRDPLVDLKGALPPVRVRHHPSITEPSKIGELLRAIHGYRCKSLPVSSALRLAPLVFVRPGELRWDVRAADQREHDECRAAATWIYERGDDRAWVSVDGVDAAQ